MEKLLTLSLPSKRKGGLYGLCISAGENSYDPLLAMGALQKVGKEMSPEAGLEEV
jgi:hypothetical protein